MKKDIQNGQDLIFLVRAFYQKAMTDPIIGHFFNEVVQLDLDRHIPHIASFWESILLGIPGFQGNPMTKHIELNRKSEMKPEHFERWLNLWAETVRMHFEGPMADQAIERSENIASVMQYKVRKSQEPGFIH